MKRNHLALYPNGLAKQTGLHHGNKVDSLDYAEIAKAFGGFGRRVDDAADLRQGDQGCAGGGERRTDRDPGCDDGALARTAHINPCRP